VNAWEQCGGKLSYDGPSTVDQSVCCPGGTSCKYVNDWYWQCQPSTNWNQDSGSGGSGSGSGGSGSSSGSSGSSSMPPAASSGCQILASVWSQCGGLSGSNKANAADPQTCCQGGACAARAVRAQCLDTPDRTQLNPAPPR
jgi:hypothetical protein